MLTRCSYKSYLIVCAINGEYIVEKDSIKICTFKTLEQAKKEIDYLIGE